MSSRMKRRNRSGAMLIVALVVLAVVLAMTATLTRAMVSFGRESQFPERQFQALLLVEAGLERALRTAGSDENYSGETWKMSEESLEPAVAGTIVIRVEKPAQAESQRRVLVEAVYPDTAVRRFAFQRELLVPFPASQPSPPSRSSDG